MNGGVTILLRFRNGWVAASRASSLDSSILFETASREEKRKEKIGRKEKKREREKREKREKRKKREKRERGKMREVL